MRRVVTAALGIALTFSLGTGASPLVGNPPVANDVTIELQPGDFAAIAFDFSDPDGDFVFVNFVGEATYSGASDTFFLTQCFCGRDGVCSCSSTVTAGQESGTITFPYSVQDSTGLSSNVATVTVVVGGVGERTHEQILTDVSFVIERALTALDPDEDAEAVAFLLDVSEIATHVGLLLDQGAFEEAIPRIARLAKKLANAIKGALGEDGDENLESISDTIESLSSLVEALRIQAFLDELCDMFVGADGSRQEIALLSFIDLMLAVMRREVELDHNNFDVPQNALQGAITGFEVARATLLVGGAANFDLAKSQIVRAWAAAGLGSFSAIFGSIGRLIADLFVDSLIARLIPNIGAARGVQALLRAARVLRNLERLRRFRDAIDRLIRMLRDLERVAEALDQIADTAEKAQALLQFSQAAERVATLMENIQNGNAPTPQELDEAQQAVQAAIDAIEELLSDPDE